MPELTHPALAGWLEANGMTLAEATRVQPSYCFEACPDAGMHAVCGADGHVYANACLADCEGVTIVGAASCEGGSCTCSDAGVANVDSGTSIGVDAGAAPRVDAGSVTPRIDGGSGGAVDPGGSCSVGHGAGGSDGAGLALIGIAIAIVARRRRR